MSQYKDFIGKLVLPHQLYVGKIVYVVDIYLQVVHRHKVVSKLITTDKVYPLPRYNTLISINNKWYQDQLLLAYMENPETLSVKRVFHTKKAAEEFLQFSYVDPACTEIVEQLVDEYRQYDDYLPDPTDWLGSE